MPKTCYYGLKSNRKISKYELITPLLAYIFVKRNIPKKGHGRSTFSFTITIIREVHAHEFIYKALILDHKQFLKNMIDHEATRVSYTT